MTSQALKIGESLGQHGHARQLAGFCIYDAVYAPEVRLPRHDHEAAAICHVRAGGYEETWAGSTALNTPGSVVLHPAGAHHANVHGRETVALTVLEFETSWLDKIGEGRPMLPHQRSLGGGPIARLAVKAYRELYLNDASSGLALEGLALEMLAQSARLGGSGDSARPGWLGRVEEILHGTLDATLPLEALATAAGVHRVHLARTFRRHFGCSIGDYHRRIRVDAACRQLEAGGTIAQVAADAGFADQSHFSRVFRQIRAVSPGSFKRAVSRA